MGKVTNKDIAERAGVSAAAVSLAIHGRKGISEATRANILRIVQEMNYAPPSRSCTDSRAVVLIPGTGLRMPPPALLQGIADFAAQQRAQLHILTLQQLMEDFPAKLTGCMLLVTFDELDRSKLDLIASASPDILVLDGNFSRKPFFNVRWDYAAAAYRLVCWLTQLGHRNFVYINEDFSPDKNLIVFSGFQRQILQMHLPLNPVQLVMDYMKKTPDLLGAYTTAGAACACWAAAKRALGRDDMIIVGTDYTDETLDLVERGEVQAFVAQPLYEEAQTSVIALDTLLRGNSYPFFTSLDAPLVTRANMDRYRKLLQDVNNWYA